MQGNVSFGMGMSHSPVPMGQVTMAPSPPLNAPRGPFAPVAANQAMLQPLIPTQTGFSSFVPTRAPAFQSPPPLPHMQTSPSPALMLPQQTGMPMLNSGMGGAPLMHPTGMQMQGHSGGLMAQPMGMNMGMNNNFGGAQFSPAGFLQPSPTGFNPQMSGSFGQQFGNNPPPVPPLPSQQVKDTTPANVFASMKSGTFEDDSAPRSGDVYDPFRGSINPSIQIQPTGWVNQGYNQGAMGYHH